MPESHSRSNPFEAPRETPQETPPANATDVYRSTARTNSLVAMYVLAALSGAGQIFDYPTVYFVCSLLLAFAATNWAVVDTRIRGGHFVGILRVIYFLLWPIASFFYLIATRKLRGLAWWGLNAVGLFGTVTVTSIATFYLLYSIGRMDLIDPTLLE